MFPVLGRPRGYGVGNSTAHSPVCQAVFQDSRKALPDGRARCEPALRQGAGTDVESPEGQPAEAGLRPVEADRLRFPGHQ